MGIEKRRKRWWGEGGLGENGFCCWIVLGSSHKNLPYLHSQPKGCFSMFVPPQNFRKSPTAWHNRTYDARYSP